MYLEKRRRRWYAIHEIPADVREAIGRGKRFFQSLETEDRVEAKIRATKLEVEWLSEIEKARRGTTDHIESAAAFWRKTLRETPEEERPWVLERIADEADAREHSAASQAGVFDHRDPSYEDVPGVQEARRFFAAATGKLVRMDEHLDEYLGTLTSEAKTVDMKRSTLEKFFQTFPYVRDVTRREVQRWVNRVAQEGKAVATIRRSLSDLRGYWAYLISIEAASENNLPFERLTVPKPSKSAKGAEEREAFAPGDVVALLRAAEANEDKQLADLIRLGMWSGARIEELCALKTSQVKDGHFTVEDAKTPAGRRQVPIHSKLKPTMSRLLKESTDGYVLSELPPNKYGDRSNAVGKRFGRLKKAKGFGAAYVFHSIRKTVATLMENAGGVPENVGASILGHEYPTMTYGTYSGGPSLEVKREALEKIDYPDTD